MSMFGDSATPLEAVIAIMSLQLDAEARHPVSLGQRSFSIGEWGDKMLEAIEQSRRVRCNDGEDLFEMPEGTIVSWYAVENEPESETVGILHHNDDGTAWLAHSLPHHEVSLSIVNCPAFVHRIGAAR